MKDNQTRLIHVPHGNGQPYYQQPFERMPRMPRQGQPVICGAVIDPMDGAETLDLEWQLPGQPSTFTPCVCIGDSDSVGNSGTHRAWSGVIPPVFEPTQVSYRFHARTGFETLASPWYTYSLFDSLTLTSLESWTLDSDQIFLSRIQTTSGISVFFGCGFATQDHHTFTYGLGFDEQALRQSLAKKIPHPTKPQVQEQTSNLPSLVLIWNDYHLDINPKNFQFRLENQATGEVIQECISMEINGFTTPDSRRLSTANVTFSAPEDMGYYGFGERYNALNQAGQILSNRVFEQYKNQKLKTYMPIPFFFTNHQWGMFIDTDRTVDFHLGSTQTNCYSVEAEFETSLVTHVFMGQPKQILQAYYGYEGQPVAPPDWVFGLWMSGNEWNNQARVLEVVKRTQELDIPTQVIVIEAWSDETTFYRWNDTPAPAHLPDGYWPDPKGMVEWLHAQGLKLILWQIPVIKASPNPYPADLHRNDEKFVRDHNLVFLEADGTPYQVRPGWFRGSMLPDFTDTETRRWWFGKREYLLTEFGIDGFKTDGGEHLWGYEVQAPTGGYGDDKINTFPKEYLEAYTEFISSHRDQGQERILFSRAGYRGAHRTPMHWSGDQDSTWEAYQGTIRAMLNANLSGISFIGWDIGGFTGPMPTPELYMRSAAASAFSPLMQYHSEHNGHKKPIVDRTPWNIAEFWNDPAVVDQFRFLAYLRQALVPYLIQESTYAVVNSQPLMQPLFFPYPDDPRTWNIEDQYFFGRFLLVAPIFIEGAQERALYLPAGEWEDLWSGKLYPGGTNQVAQADRTRIPVFLNRQALRQAQETQPQASAPDFRLIKSLVSKLR
jgi:alpha-glucosidase (family GH31 glycosyl hydrolase)